MCFIKSLPLTSYTILVPFQNIINSACCCHVYKWEKLHCILGASIQASSCRKDSAFFVGTKLIVLYTEASAGSYGEAISSYWQNPCQPMICIHQSKLLKAESQKKLCRLSWQPFQVFFSAHLLGIVFCWNFQLWVLIFCFCSP